MIIRFSKVVKCESILTSLQHSTMCASPFICLFIVDVWGFSLAKMLQRIALCCAACLVPVTAVSPEQRPVVGCLGYKHLPPYGHCQRACQLSLCQQCEVPHSLLPSVLPDYQKARFETAESPTERSRKHVFEWEMGRPKLVPGRHTSLENGLQVDASIP